MNKELKLMTEEWMSLERETFEQRKKAEQYYDDNLMSLIEEDFIARNKDVVIEKIEYLIVSVGTSYEPIVLDLALFSPSHIFFIYTNKSASTLDKVVEYCGLKPSEYEKSRVNETDPIDIYREVKNAYLMWNRPKEMTIDFTGGTKAMSAACALAGSIINVRMIYVASDDYLVDFRKPNPGSERLVYIDNPLAVFGDIEEEKAYRLLNEYNFAGAYEILERLEPSIPDPMKRQEIHFASLLAKAYAKWDDLNLAQTSVAMSDLIAQIRRDANRFPGNAIVENEELLKKQLKQLQILSSIPDKVKERKQKDILKDKSTIIALMFTMRLGAMTRESQGKNDMGALLMYRLLEMIEQRRLARYNLFVSEMRYEQLKPNIRRIPELGDMSSQERIEWLASEVAEIKSEIFRSNRSSSYRNFLPNPVSLMDGFILLSALKDPVIYAPGKNQINILKKLRSMVILRNNSIFAHGLGPVSKTDYLKFKDFVEALFIKFCKVEKVDFEKMAQTFRWYVPSMEEK